MLIQKMITGGIELILGSNTDAILGQAIMFGIGGIFVELYRDVVFRVLPIGLDDAREMLDSIKGSAILNGFRNYPPVDRDMLAATILNFGNMLGAYQDILEMDLNPLIWSFEENCALVVDARMTLSK